MFLMLCVNVGRFLGRRAASPTLKKPGETVYEYGAWLSSATAGAYAALSFGPGTLEQIRVFVTGPEADRLRAINHPPIYDPIAGPIGLIPDILNRAWPA